MHSISLVWTLVVVAGFDRTRKYATEDSRDGGGRAKQDARAEAMDGRGGLIPGFMTRRTVMCGGAC